MAAVKLFAREEFFGSLPVNDLELYIEIGNKAMENGDVSSSLEWYNKGLKKAIQLKDKNKIKQFSGLIVTLL